MFELVLYKQSSRHVVTIANFMIIIVNWNIGVNFSVTCKPKFKKWISLSILNSLLMIQNRISWYNLVVSDIYLFINISMKLALSLNNVLVYIVLSVSIIFAYCANLYCVNINGSIYVHSFLGKPVCWQAEKRGPLFKILLIPQILDVQPQFFAVFTS